MPAIVDRPLKKNIDHRRQTMQAEFEHWKGHYRELRDAIEPARGRFVEGERRSDSSINKRMLDSTAPTALRVLKSGLMAGITSPSRPWFRLGLHGRATDDLDFAAKEWLHEVQVRMYEILRGANIYRMLNATYGDLGLYGTAANAIMPDFEDVVRGHHFQTGRYLLGEDGNGRVTGLYREVPMTVRGIVESWGENRVSRHVKKAWDRGDYYQSFTICHLIDKRAGGDPKSLNPSGRPWSSVYWEKNEDGNFLEIGGHRSRPLLCPRWEQVEGEAWSQSSPGMLALGDALQLQVLQREKAIAIQKMHNPPLIGGPMQAGSRAGGNPGAGGTGSAGSGGAGIGDGARAGRGSGSGHGVPGAFHRPAATEARDDGTDRCASAVGDDLCADYGRRAGMGWR